MISQFVKEQKRYTRDELKNIFTAHSKECSETDVIRIIKKLKEYGVLKCVKGTELQLSLSDLADEDVEVVDDCDNQSRFYYVFTFVGIIIVEGRILKCYPKYIKNNIEPTEELHQVIKVLRKYDSKEQIIRMHSFDVETSTYNRLSVIMFLLNDYFENGIYANEEESIETNGTGEIHWDKTINGTYPMIQDNRPYYFELLTKQRINNTEDYFKRLHECILTKCTDELKRAGLIDILDMEEVILSGEDLTDFGDEEYILYNIGKELGVQFNTRKQIVLKAIESIILNKSNLEDENSFSMFGTNSFNLVWQKVCEEVMDNKLHTRIKDLGLSNVSIPEGAIYTVEDELISIIDKPQWCGKKDNKAFSKNANKTLEPDLVSIYKEDDVYVFGLFDAKYYCIQLEPNKDLLGQPGVGDITKQYLYQLAFMNFIEANKISKVLNWFLLPTEKQNDIGVFHIGYVKLDMLKSKRLEDIQVILLNAPLMYDYYLSNRKMRIRLDKK